MKYRQLGTLLISAPASASGKTAQNPGVKPIRQKYSSLPKFGNIVCVAHPSPAKGRSYVVTNAGWSAVDAGGVKGGLVRAGRDEPRELGTSRDRRTAPMPCEASWRSRVGSRTAKPCGPGRRCYGQALAKASSRQPAWCREFRGVTEAKGIRLRGERGIGRQTTAQGRPGFGCPVSPLCIACAIVSHGGFMGASRRPVFPVPFPRRG